MDQLHALMAEMPGWLAAILTAVVAFIIAWIAKIVISSVINRTKFGMKAKTTGGNLGNALGRAAFWLILLFFIPPVLGYLNLSEYGSSINELLTNITGYAPKILGAALILGIGYIIAKIAQMAVTSTLSALQVDSVVSRFGLTEATGSSGSIAKGLGALVFILIIVPAVIGSLGALEIDSISVPLTNMLNTFVSYIDEIIAASIVLGLSIFIGRFIANFLKGFLPTLGVDRSINTLMSMDDGEGLKFAPSSVLGNLAFIIIAVLGLTAALDILGIEFLSSTFDEIVAFGGQLLRAAILIMIGVFLASFIARIMAGVISPKIAELFKYVAMLIFIFLGLSSLDPEGQIIPIAFGALVVGGAVAGAIAFGVGGRDWAGQVLNKMFPPKNIEGPAAVKKAPTRKAPVRRAAPPKK